MSETPLSPALTRAFEDRVGLGSWTGFTSSLARFLDEVCRPPTQQGESVEAAIDPSGGTLLLTAPFPMVRPGELVPQGRWSRLLTGLSLVIPPAPSLDLPGVALVGRSDGVEVSLPELDAQGRVLLGSTERRILGAIDWQENHHVFARSLSDADETANLVIRILIKMLEVVHPADLDYLLRVHSDIN